MSNHKKNSQHTTPKCFLKNFSDDGVTLYRKFKRVNPDNKQNIELDKPAYLKSVTTKDNFYTVKSGKEPMLVENLIYSQTIENYYPAYYNMLTNPGIRSLSSMEDRSRLLMCLLSLHCRTPKQFKLFFESVPREFNSEIDKIKEDYKVAHIHKTLIAFIEAHEFKVIRIAKITDSSEFITSDNPVLIISPEGVLKNNEFKEQFNSSNKLLIPIDRKHCCILVDAEDKRGVNINGKVFFNKIERVEVDCSFTQNVNILMLRSADEFYFGSEEYMKAFFSFIKLV